MIYFIKFVSADEEEVVGVRYSKAGAETLKKEFEETLGVEDGEYIIDVVGNEQEL